MESTSAVVQPPLTRDEGGTLFLAPYRDGAAVVLKVGAGAT